MKRTFAAIGAAALGVFAGGCSAESAKKLTVTGAGASFPAPVYQNWSYSYTKSHSGVRINYQSLGSGAGVNQIKAGTVDFAGTDAPLTVAEQRDAGVFQFPQLTGAVVVIVNLPGINAGEVKLGRAELAGIFLGRIVRWNDPALVRRNPGVKLPDLPVTVVRRADASGTSSIFTDYLCKISPEWQKTAGRGAAVKWPVGIGGQKNPGVCNSVARIKGAIGYTEYTYAAEARLAMVQLENRAGKFVRPTMESFRAGTDSADWNAPGFYLMLTDQPGEKTWPVIGVTYILVRRDCKPEIKQALAAYFNWCFTTGAAAAKKLHYTPIPEQVLPLIRAEWAK